MSEKKDENLQDFLTRLMNAGKKGAEGSSALNKLFGNTISDGLLQGLPNGIPGSKDNMNTLTKATVIILQLESKLTHLENLIAPITMIARNDKYLSTEAISRIREILKDIEVQEIDCNGDCNNCDKEH